MTYICPACIRSNISAEEILSNERNFDVFIAQCDIFPYYYTMSNSQCNTAKR